MLCEASRQRHREVLGFGLQALQQLCAIWTVGKGALRFAGLGGWDWMLAIAIAMEGWAAAREGAARNMIERLSGRWRTRLGSPTWNVDG